MKLIAVRSIVAIVISAFVLNSKSSAVAQFSQITTPLGVHSHFNQQPFNQQPIITGPAIWQIGRSPALPALPTFITPMVMPQQQFQNNSFQNNSNIGVQPYYPPSNTIIILGGYDNPYYYNGDMNYYPSVFGAYYGLPTYIYTPSQFVSFDPNGNLVFQDIGSYYPYSFDPFGSGNNLTVSSAGQFGGAISDALNNFAAGWASGNSDILSSYLTQYGSVSVGYGNQYEYNIGDSAYLQLATNSMRRLDTSDFHYTGVRFKPSGDILASAVQTYHGTDGSKRQSALQMAFTRDTSLSSGYRLTGFSVSK